MGLVSAATETVNAKCAILNRRDIVILKNKMINKLNVYIRKVLVYQELFSQTEVFPLLYKYYIKLHYSVILRFLHFLYSFFYMYTANVYVYTWCI